MSIESELIQNIINDIVIFYCNKLNIDKFNINVKFEIISSKNYIYKYSNSNPLVSTVTFLSGNNLLFYFTDIDFYKYKYKMFDDANNLHVVFTNKYKHIYYNKNKFNGIDSLNELSEDLLFIDIYYNNNNYTYKCNNDNIIDVYEYNNNILNMQNINNKKIYNILNYNFYDNLIYKNNISSFNFIKILNEDINISDNIYLLNTNNDTQYINSNMTNDINMVYNIKDEYGWKANRFMQRLYQKNFYDLYICNWLINEITFKTYTNNTYHVDNSDIFFSFIVFTIPEIITFIQKQYNINETQKYDVSAINILKIDNNYSNQLTNSFFTAIIPLNNVTIFFNDETFRNYDTGDIIVFSKLHKFNINFTDCIKFCIAIDINIL